MTLTVERLTPANLDRCMGIWADAPVLAGPTLDLLRSRVRLLLQRRMAIGSLVVSGAAAHAYGVTVFVRKGEIESLLRRDRAQIGTAVLLDYTGAPGTILDARGIGMGNASEDGLDMLVISTHVRSELGRFDEALGLLMRAYQEDHQGYRLSTIASEVFGDAYIQAVLANKGYTVRRIFQDVGGRPGFRSLVGTVTRDEARASSMGLFLPMFVYAPPVIRFTEPEQELLRLAVGGGTDEWMSTRLGLSLTAVKARWMRIHQRTMRRLPALFEHLPTAAEAGRRGAQTRHIVLNYVRRMPSELTPYDASVEAAAASGSASPAPLSTTVQGTRVPPEGQSAAKMFPRRT